ncbi:tetratricopeptide repeat protein [Dongia sedimenti]|uniref:Tetratricopeptide repeat protein n=1 Tax=Dongia sedimenti TaxID=3064282 RepID=A0ABU0YS54_9PROT|nr:tetratricopeptide repeat protein [Rhodospirillaceae bacterium R-7]
MDIAGLVILLVQIGIAVHALRTGRPLWWLAVILFFPLLGALIYFLVEIVPELRGSRAIRGFGSDILKTVVPNAGLHRRAEELAVCGSVQNKLALAEECTTRGHFDEAIKLYESAREGQFEDAPDLLLGLARVRFYNGEPQAARTLLEQLAAADPDYYPQDVAILKARAADAAGDSETALRELAAMLDRSVGLEARFRYGEILARAGKTQQARTELKNVVTHARKFRIGPTERPWARRSRQLLASLG